MRLQILLEHIIALIAINFIGLCCFGLMFYIIQKKHEDKSQKIKAAIELGLIALIVLIVIFANIGVYFWIKSGDYRATLMVLPMILCVIPIFFPVVSLGMYIQLVYRDKIEFIVKSVADKNKPL